MLHDPIPKCVLFRITALAKSSDGLIPVVAPINSIAPRSEIVGDIGFTAGTLFIICPRITSALAWDVWLSGSAAYSSTNTSMVGSGAGNVTGASGSQSFARISIMAWSRSLIESSR